MLKLDRVLLKALRSHIFGQPQPKCRVGALVNPTSAADYALENRTLLAAPQIAANQVFNVNENSAAATVVGTVIADDPDAGQSLTYAITDGNIANAFSIDDSTGQISVSAGANLDFEALPIYNLTVSVTDNGLPSTTTSANLQIRLRNDLENTQSSFGTIVPLYKFPYEGNVLQSWWQEIISTATQQNPITVVINPQNGEVTPPFGDYPPYEKALRELRSKPHIRIIGYVHARVSPVLGAPLRPVADVVANVNNYAQYYKDARGASMIDGIFVDEMTPGAETVSFFSQVRDAIRSASGLANNLIIGNPGNFTTASLTPHLTARTADVFMREDTQNPETFLNELRNGQTASVVSDPQFDNINFIGVLGQVTSEAQMKEFLRELKLAKYDYGYITAGSDYNERPPLFEELVNQIPAPFIESRTISIDENLPNWTLLPTFRSGDPNPGQGLSYSIIGGNTGGAFAIDQGTGQIRVANTAAINFETNPIFDLQVTVTEVGAPSLSDTNTIQIALNDVSEPEIDVRDQLFGAPTTIPDNTGTMAWENVTQGAAVGVRTLSVHNTGLANLVLQPATVTAASGFSVVNNFTPGQVIGPGGVAWITLALDSTTAGPKSATLSLPNNDPDENPYNFALTATIVVPPVVTIIDDGASGFSQTGTWITVAGSGREADRRYAGAGNATATANWSFSGLVPGLYRISANWVANANRANNAAYSASTTLGGPAFFTTTANQRLAPASFTAEGTTWQNLGTVSVVGNTLVVRLANTTTGFVEADGMRIERIGSNTTIIDDGATGFSTPTGSWIVNTGSGRDGDRRYVAAGNGNAIAQWSFSSLAPGRYRVAANWTAAANRTTNAAYSVSQTPGGSPLLTAAINQQNSPSSFTAEGTTWQDLGTVLVGGNLVVRLTNTATGIVEADAIRLERIADPVVTIDDGAAGFSQTGSWINVAGSGRDGDRRYAVTGNATATATWSFNGLAAGTYRVVANYVANANRASDAAYQIQGGAAPLNSTINQRFAPGSLTADGTTWQDVGTVTLVGSTLVVRLSNTLSGFVEADAIRIEWIG